MERTLSYATNFSLAPQYKLIEVDESLLEQILQDGVSIKGKSGEEAVLCTKSSTFGLRLLESTNTLLLVDEADTSKLQIVGSISCHYETSLIPPRLHLLKDLLQSKDYEGPRRDKTKTGTVYTFEQLKSRIQASEQELRRALLELNAFELEGFCRILNSNYEAEIMDLLLTEVITSDWTINKIPEKAAVQQLSDQSEYDTCSVLQCLRKYSQRSEPFQIGGENYWTLDPQKLCIFKATQLLTLPNKSWTLTAFQAKWRDEIPEEWQVEADISMLKGYAIVTLDLDPKVVYLPLSSLSLDPNTRIKELFHVQKQWTLEDITPYLQDYATTNTTVEQFLLRCSRIVQTAAGRRYCAK